MDAALRTWSKQQEAIFNWFAKDQSVTYPGFGIALPEHLIVRARAGTGKSTTIREGVKRAPETSILIAAFSKNIQLDMERLIGQFAGQVKTLHAVGYACVRRFRDNIKVAFTSDRADALAQQVCGITVPDAIVRLVSKLHTKGREIAPHATKLGDLSSIQITFECEPEAQWEPCTRCGHERVASVHDAVSDRPRHDYAGYDATYVEQKALEAMELASQVKSGETIDGSDMIFLPVRNGWLTKQFDLVVVDEAQDMTTAQLEIAQGVLKTGGRICIVGDDRQAIFAFRGADADSLDRLKDELGAAELGLVTTYRCGKRIVDLARGYVPDFKAGENNPDGVISEITYAALIGAAGPGDFILSRVNAPLVSTAMKLLRAGKRTRVAGKDIGKGLVGLIRKLKARTVPELLQKIEAWAARENIRNRKALEAAVKGRKQAIQAKIEAILDQADMLQSLTDGAKNVDEVTARIEALFTDDGLGAAGVITCSSVHRAKGLEANRVFILRDTLRTNTQEEENICYVAITRAKNELVWVSKEN
jgi:superfamily I DNA/RNA helicase